MARAGVHSATRLAAALRGVHTHAPSVHTCAPTVSQRRTLGAHVHTHRVAASHPRCTRAHPPCRSVAPSVHTCTPTVSQRCTLGALLHTSHAASPHARCAAARAWCCSVTPRRGHTLSLDTSSQPPGTVLDTSEPRTARRQHSTRNLQATLSPVGCGHSPRGEQFYSPTTKSDRTNPIWSPKRTSTFAA